MKLRLTARVHRDLVGIASFIEKENPVAAATVVQRIDATLKIIKDMPKVGRHGARPNTRELVVRGLPLLIVYRLAQDTIEVLTIFHTSQHPKRK